MLCLIFVWVFTEVKTKKFETLFNCSNFCFGWTCNPLIFKKASIFFLARINDFTLFPVTTKSSAYRIRKTPGMDSIAFSRPSKTWFAMQGLSIPPCGTPLHIQREIIFQNLVF